MIYYGLAYDYKRYDVPDSYRALLIRARQGMVICVPKGDTADATRSPEFYDSIYEYLRQIGLDEL